MVSRGDRKVVKKPLLIIAVGRLLQNVRSECKDELYQQINECLEKGDGYVGIVPDRYTDRGFRAVFIDPLLDESGYIKSQHFNRIFPARWNGKDIDYIVINAGIKVAERNTASNLINDVSTMLNGLAAIDIFKVLAAIYADVEIQVHAAGEDIENIRRGFLAMVDMQEDYFKAIKNGIRVDN
jgi:hypothetical protein